MILLSAALASLAVLVLRPPWSWVRVRMDRARLPRPGRRTGAAALTVAVVVSLSVASAPAAIVGWTGVAVAGTAARRVVSARRRRRTDARRAEAHAIVDALVAELRSGAPPTIALARLAREFDLLTAPASVAGSGGDVVAALIATGDRPGAHPLADLGRAWAVSDACGAPLVAVLEQVRETARSDRELQRELAAGVAPARATATLVAAMPPLGLALGTGLGVDPLSVVLTTVPGAVCVALGIGCAIVGVLWIDAIADRTEAQA